MSGFTLTAKQAAVRDQKIAGPAKHVLLYGGSRSGKTALFCYGIAVRALAAAGSRHAIFRRYGVAVKQSIGLDTMPKVLRLAWPDLPVTWRDQDGYFALPNGSEIWLAGLDDKERVDKVLGKEFCVDPASLVLTADLRWVRADSLSVGDELVGFPENLEGHCKLLPSTVQRADIIQAQKFRIVTDRGETVVSAGHKFVAQWDDRRKRDARKYSWKEAQHLKVGDQIRFTAEPWTEGQSKQDGWFAGMLDGEGYSSKLARTVGVAQCPSPALDMLEAWMVSNSVAFRRHIATGAHGAKGPCHQLIACGIWPAMRMLGIARPYRLDMRFWEGARAFTAGGYDAKVIAVEPLGEGPVVALGTSSRTFIADGFLGHNSTLYFNEASEIPYQSYLVAQTRLAQAVDTVTGKPLRLKDFVDLNPTTRTHWTYRLWQDGVNPEDESPINRDDYVWDQVNPLDNKENLPPDYLEALEALPERQKRRFFLGEYSGDDANAIWRRDMFKRVSRPWPVAMRRIVVAIDPAVSNTPGSDETGIVACGLGVDGNGYVLDDASGRYSPEEWARKAIALYHEHEADKVIGEVNNGGDMVRAVIRAHDPLVPFAEVRASRGKVTRAEPVAALYERGKVFHADGLRTLEDQMCLAAGTMVETNRGLVAIEDVAAGDQVLTREGFAPVEISCETGRSSLFVLIEADGGRLIRCTETHPIFDATSGQFVPARNVRPGMRLLASPNSGRTAGLSHGAAAGGIGCRAGTIDTQRARCSIGRFGRRTSARSLTASTFTIATATRATTHSTISPAYLRAITTSSMARADGTLTASIAGHRPEWGGRTESGASQPALIAGRSSLHRIRAALDTARRPAVSAAALPSGSGIANAWSVGRRSKPATLGASIAVQRVTTERVTAEPVYNLKVADGFLPEFFANGVLVHNCSFTIDFDAKAAGWSPDRVDALVWGFKDLFASLTQPRPTPTPLPRRRGTSWMAT